MKTLLQISVISFIKLMESAPDNWPEALSYSIALREKQAESRLQALRDLLAEGLSSDDPVEWEKDAFLKKVKAGVRATGENR